jgi:2-polyprenyl-6-methoxyphenol hydroxylase-like FAD-dependent oxidoreductase
MVRTPPAERSLSHTSTGDRVVVVGASIAGLLAARAVSDKYPSVTVVDRDALPEAPTGRRGVPQGRQLHVLLARGRETFDELFPGLSDELVSIGAPLVDLHEQFHWYNDGYRMRRAPSPLLAVGVSRPLLEHVVRARVMALPGVEFLSSHEVTGVTATPDRRRITGVRVWPRATDGAERVLAANLVVDAGGRGARSPVWLAELGYPAAPVEEVRVDVTYLTRVYRREPHHLDGLLGLVTNAVPGAPRAAVMAAVEDDQIAVAMSGMLGEQPPTDPEALADFATALAAPQVAEFVRTAVPTGEPATMRYPASVRRHYERMQRYPEGHLAIGDALCSFNPIYGQGMTVAAQEASLLRRLLADQTVDLPRRFYRGAARLIDNPWSIAVGTDLRFPEVAGRRTARVRFINAYIHRLHMAASIDPVLGAAFLRVINLIDPPTSLLSPRIVTRVLRGHRSATRRGGAAVVRSAPGEPFNVGR